jgi:hypothetical protein
MHLLSSPARRSQSGQSTLPGSIRDEEQDSLTVEKSRVLEQLRHTAKEVDQLESRLQAIRRRRARAMASALQKHQELQDSEAQEMRCDVQK